MITIRLTGGTRHIIARSAPHCKVLQPGEFNNIISQSLPVSAEIFTTTTVTVFSQCNIVTNIARKVRIHAAENSTPLAITDLYMDSCIQPA